MIRFLVDEVVSTSLASVKCLMYVFNFKVFMTKSRQPKMPVCHILEFCYILEVVEYTVWVGVISLTKKVHLEKYLKLNMRNIYFYLLDLLTV